MSATAYEWPTLSIRDEMAEFWDRLAEAIAESRTRGFIRFLPDLALAVLVTLLMLLFLTISKLCGVTNFIWLRIVPWGAYHRARRVRKRRDDGFRRMFLRRATHPKPRHPLTRPASRHASSAEKTTDMFFGRLPPEIRSCIQVMAFGDRTIHMDLRFDHPFNLVEKRPYPAWAIHARIHSQTIADNSHLRDSQEMGWRWFGCVCHRYPPRGTYLSLGRRRNLPWGHFREPDIDLCLKGSGLCNEWPGEWPLKCQIGIMGWLLSCRNAYVEGIDILYSTNTIHIASPVLLRSIQDIIPQPRLSEMTSLELVWKPKEIPLNEGFISQDPPNSTSQSISTPIFPSLIYLRISFKRLVYGAVDESTGLSWPYDSKALLAEKLHNHTLPMIDRLLERIVPPTTDVTVSCSKWDWYEAIDMRLIEEQGVEKTRPQRADIEGLKCWREVPRKEDQESDNPRRGYWIHMPIEDVHLDQGMDYDWHRHELYNLGEKRYRYC
ncbi:hypothetical protein B0T10DRAFT_47503 [Thelonectria olida]|uniref:DUF7730 domain-containing protein n=1 Tax=Thelonectria olida TaxID=1576542 RepID=A0A9P9APM8_9HYPO|nr:hypothetical protein B0T10DRAFT_47503 [Thelonectria olida]